MYVTIALTVYVALDHLSVDLFLDRMSDVANTAICQTNVMLEI